jgi:hypothetical protein
MGALVLGKIVTQNTQCEKWPLTEIPVNSLGGFFDCLQAVAIEGCPVHVWQLA